MKILWRWLGRVAIGMLLLLAAFVAPSIWPDPFFPHCVKQDRLSLCSDRPFDEAHARRLLSEIAARLARSPLNDSLEHKIFILNAPWRIAVFMHGGSAAAISVYPRARNVFVRHADIDANIFFHADGTAAQPPRNLVYLLTHEISHSLVGERVGATRYFKLPVWVQEGHADYIGMGSGGIEDDPRLLYRRYRAHDPIFASDLSYYRYRMLASYFLTVRGWTLNRLLASDLSAAQAQQAMDQDASANSMK